MKINVKSYIKSMKVIRKGFSSSSLTIAFTFLNFEYFKRLYDIILVLKYFIALFISGMKNKSSELSK